LPSSSAARPLVYFSDVIKILGCCLKDKMSTCCDKFARVFLILLNLTFLLLGLAQIGLGAFCHVRTKALDFLGNDYVNPPVIIIILGAIISVVSFFGCIGAIKHSANKCMLWTYSSLLLLLLIAQIGGVIGVYHYPGDLRPGLKTKMEAGLKNYGALDHHGVNIIWDEVQTGLQCCGVNTWTDWQSVSTRGLKLKAVPESCCKNRQEDCGKNPSQENLYSQGCFTALSNAFSNNLHYIGGTLLSVALAELIVISMACWLGRRMGLQSQSQSSQEMKDLYTVVSSGETEPRAEKVPELYPSLSSVSASNLDSELS